MIQAFKQVRLTNTLLSGSGSALVFGGTPLVFVNQTGGFVSISQTGQFVDTSKTGGFVSISQTGQFVTTALTGGFVSISQTGQFITTAMTGQYAPAGMTGQFITSAQTGQFAPAGMTGQFLVHSDTGVLLARGETGLFYPMSNPLNFITAAQAGGVSAISVSGASISGNVILSGVGGTNVSFSGNYVLISGGSIGNTGQFVDSSKTGNFVTNGMTGSFITNTMTGVLLSRGETGQFMWTGSSMTFTTVIPMNVDSTGIFFPATFNVAPRVLASIEVTGDIMYMVNVRTRTTTGYVAIFSDTITENGVTLHTFASTV